MRSVDFHYRQLLSAGRKLSHLGFACEVSAFPLLPAGVNALRSNQLTPFMQKTTNFTKGICFFTDYYLSTVKIIYL